MITADTNIFVYTLDPRDPLKQAVAKEVVARARRGRSPVALQVVGEFQNVLRRKLRFPPAEAAISARDVLTSFDIFLASTSAADAALTEMVFGRLSYWDTLMLVSAAEAGCTAMLSEDMQDGAVLHGVEIVNPFDMDGMSPRAAERLGFV